MIKIGVDWRLGVTQGHRKHCHSAYDFLFDFNGNYTSILYRFRFIAHFSSKVTNFNPPHLHLSPPYWVIPFEFHSELWCQKTRVPALSCGVICVILRLAVLIQYRSVTDTHTDRQTDRHTTTAYTALSIASRGKNSLNFTYLPTSPPWTDFPQILQISWSHMRHIFSNRLRDVDSAEGRKWRLPFTKPLAVNTGLLNCAACNLSHLRL